MLHFQLRHISSPAGEKKQAISARSIFTDGRIDAQRQ
jgi:hypothetical protein